MSVATLLDELAESGITIGVAADTLDTLEVEAPAGALTNGLCQRIRGHKAELLCILTSADGTEDFTTIPQLTPTRRREMARPIWEARWVGNPNLAVALRDGWEERVAICTIDGGLSQHEAETIAWREIAAITSDYA